VVGLEADDEDTEAVDEGTEVLLWDKESGGTSQTDTFGKDKPSGSINLPRVSLRGLKNTTKIFD